MHSLNVYKAGIEPCSGTNPNCKGSGKVIPILFNMNLLHTRHGAYWSLHTVYYINVLDTYYIVCKLQYVPCHVCEKLM